MDEYINFLIIGNLVVVVCRDILWDVLAREISPERLKTQFENKAFRQKVKLHPAQINKILSVGYNDRLTSEYFDVSGLYKILKTACPDLNEPTNGWGKTPIEANIAVADDIERVINLRNRIYAHATESSISNKDFNIYWDMVWLVASRIDGKFKTRNMEKMRALEDRDNSLKKAQQIKDEVKQLQDYDRETRQIISTIEDRVKQLEEEKGVHKTPSKRKCIISLPCIPIGIQIAFCIGFMFGKLAHLTKETGILPATAVALLTSNLKSDDDCYQLMFYLDKNMRHICNSKFENGSALEQALMTWKRDRQNSFEQEVYYAVTAIGRSDLVSKLSDLSSKEETWLPNIEVLKKSYMSYFLGPCENKPEEKGKSVISTTENGSNEHKKNVIQTEIIHEDNESKELLLLKGKSFKYDIYEVHSVVNHKNNSFWLFALKHEDLNLMDIDGNQIDVKCLNDSYITDLQIGIDGSYYVAYQYGKVKIFSADGRNETIINEKPLNAKNLHLTKTGNMYVGLIDVYDLEKRKPTNVRIVRKYTKTGTELKTFENDEKNVPLYTQPRRIHENIDETVWVIDRFSKYESRIVATYQTGSVRFIYQGGQNFRVTDFCHVGNGDMAVADYRKHQIHLLNLNGHRLKVIEREDGEVAFPLSIGLINNKFLVVASDRGVITSLDFNTTFS